VILGVATRKHAKKRLRFPDSEAAAASSDPGHVSDSC
jgi:hypothetical protein